MALLLDLCEGPTAMLTLDEDCVSVVFPPSAADSPEMTRPLEKLRFPNKRLSVDEDDETCGEEEKALPASCSRADVCVFLSAGGDDEDALVPDWSVADAVLFGAAS